MPSNPSIQEQIQVGQQVASELRPQPEQLTPPEAGLDQGQQIEVKKGLGERVLGRLGMDEASLRGAGVLRANQAQAAQDVARSNSDRSRLGSNQDAHNRAGQIKNRAAENIEPINERPL